MIRKRADTHATQQSVLECVEDIRTVATRCEEMGMLAAWATLLDVVDQMLATLDRQPDTRA